eukprot:4194640-Prymnesium_polylepis.1
MMRLSSASAIFLRPAARGWRCAPGGPGPGSARRPQGSHPLRGGARCTQALDDDLRELVAPYYGSILTGGVELPSVGPSRTQVPRHAPHIDQIRQIASRPTTERVRDAGVGRAARPFCPV